jgi:hypothetical protein
MKEITDHERFVLGVCYQESKRGCLDEETVKCLANYHKIHRARLTLLIHEQRQSNWKDFK